jgi:hypothetical protein
MAMRWRRFAALCVGCVGAAILALTLSECFAHQKQQVAKCSLDARRMYPAEKSDSSNRQDTVRVCMEAAGYEFTIASDHCVPSPYVSENAFCYRPAGIIGRYMLQVEFALSPL